MARRRHFALANSLERKGVQSTRKCHSVHTIQFNAHFQLSINKPSMQDQDCTKSEVFFLPNWSFLILLKPWAILKQLPASSKCTATSIYGKVRCEEWKNGALFRGRKRVEKFSKAALGAIHSDPLRYQGDLICTQPTAKPTQNLIAFYFMSPSVTNLFAAAEQLNEPFESKGTDRAYQINWSCGLVMYWREKKKRRHCHYGCITRYSQL